MGLLDTSGVTNTTNSSYAAKLAGGRVLPSTSVTSARSNANEENLSAAEKQIRASAAKLKSATPGTSATSTSGLGGISSSLNGLGASLGSGVSSVSSGISSLVGSGVSKVGSTLAPIASEATDLLSSGEKYVGNEVASFTSVFSKNATALSGQIGGFFKDAFSDTTSASTTTLNTNVVDPVKSLLSTPKPSTSGFKFTSGSGKPVEVALNGTKSVANGTSTLTSTQTQTLKNRFNLDDLSNLPNQLSSNAKASGVTSTFTDLFSTVSDAKSQVANGITTAESAYATAKSIPSQAKSQLNGLVNGLTGGEVTLFSGSSIGTDGSSFVSVNDATSTLYTKDSTVTADDINKLVSAAKNTVSCSTVGNVRSVNVDQTISSVLLNRASQMGLTGLVQQFMQCQSFASSKNDSTLTKIVSILGGSHPDTTNQLVSSMETPSTLNQQDYLSSVVTDPTLTSNDTADLNKLWAQIGVTPTSIYDTGSTAGGTTPTYDLSLASQTQPSVLNSVFGTGITGNSLMTDFLTSSPVTTLNNGLLSM